MDLFRQKEGVVFDPCIVFSIVIDGVQHDFETETRDTIEFRKRMKGVDLEGDDEGMFHLAWIACERRGFFEGTFDEFVDRAKRIAWGAAPPPKAVRSPKTSTKPSASTPA